MASTSLNRSTVLTNTDSHSAIFAEYKFSHNVSFQNSEIRYCFETLDRQIRTALGEDKQPPDAAYELYNTIKRNLLDHIKQRQLYKFKDDFHIIEIYAISELLNLNQTEEVSAEKKALIKKFIVLCDLFACLDYYLSKNEILEELSDVIYKKQDEYKSLSNRMRVSSNEADLKKLNDFFAEMSQLGEKISLMLPILGYFIKSENYIHVLPEKITSELKDFAELANQQYTNSYLQWAMGDKSYEPWVQLSTTANSYVTNKHFIAMPIEKPATLSQKFHEELTKVNVLVNQCAKITNKTNGAAETKSLLPRKEVKAAPRASTPIITAENSQSPSIEGSEQQHKTEGFFAGIKNKFNSFKTNHPFAWKVIKWVVVPVVTFAVVGTIIYFTGGAAAIPLLGVVMAKSAAASAGICAAVGEGAIVVGKGATDGVEMLGISRGWWEGPKPPGPAEVAAPVVDSGIKFITNKSQVVVRNRLNIQSARTIDEVIEQNAREQEKTGQMNRQKRPVVFQSIAEVNERHVMGQGL